jgi:membrane fusion protein, multidrug efflux system
MSLREGLLPPEGRCFQVLNLRARVIAVGLCCASLFACNRQPPAAAPRESDVPVVAAAASLQDVPVEVRSVGTVEAFSSVTVKPQVTGPLTGISFKDGADVKAGELLFTIDRRPYDAALSQAEANLARDMSQRENAAAQLQRSQALFDQGIIPQQQLDQAKAAKSALDGTIQADQAAIESAKLEVQYCSIYAPLEGRAGNHLVDVGNLVQSGSTTLVTINKIQPIYVSFSLPETSVNELRSYLHSGPLEVQAELPNQHSESGKVTFVDNAVDPSTGTIKLRATFSNSAEALWPGQFVDVVVTLTTRRNVIVVPSQAVQTGDNGQFVFVIGKDNIASAAPIQVDFTVNGKTVIAKGLQPGDQVVIDGQSRVTPGSKVEIRKAKL